MTGNFSLFGLIYKGFKLLFANIKYSGIGINHESLIPNRHRHWSIVCNGAFFATHCYTVQSSQKRNHQR